LLSRIAKSLREAFFPTRCLVCGSFFHPADNSLSFTEKNFQNRGVLQGDQSVPFTMLIAPFLCPACSRGFSPVESPLCLKCGAMFVSREGDDHLCGNCLSATRRYRKARAAGIYDKALMAVIHCFKYKEKIQLARPLEKLLFARFINLYYKNGEESEGIDLVVPVPLHAKRFRKRGFNQAFFLIRNWAGMAKTSGMNGPSFEIGRDILVRDRWTEPQVGLGRDQRKLNMKDAFCLNDSLRVTDKRILLIDDVYTTGTTVDECAKVLMEGGASCVDVLTLARAM
jgi:ComF family protein